MPQKAQQSSPADLAQYAQSGEAPAELEQYAAKPASGNATSTPPSFIDRLPGTPETGLKGAAMHLGQTWNAIGKPIADVSAPVIGHQIYKRLTGQPNELSELPGKMVTAFAMMGEPETDLGAVARPKVIPAAAERAVTSLEHPAVKPWVNAAKAELMKIPGADLAKTIFESARGLTKTPEVPAAPTIPGNWGQGRFGTPIDKWGQMIEPLERLRNAPLPAPQPDFIPPRPSIERIMPGSAGSLAESVAQPLTKGAKVTPIASATLERTLGEATGAPKPLVRGVPLKNQPAAQAAAGTLPEDFTPVESSLLKGYKYDPAKQELTTITKSGQRYTHGEVTPEEVKAFENSDSKGQFWNKQIRANHVQVQKNARPTVPVGPRSASPDDLTGILEESLKATKKK